MASALLASRNEPYWGERKVYMRKNPSSNPLLKANPNPNSNPNKSIYDPPKQIHGRQADESAGVSPALSNDSSSLKGKSINHNNRRESSLGGYVTFNIAAYSRRELKELKKRLISELEQVRSLSSRIELREIQSRSGYSASGGYGGKEVTSATRPPLHLNQSLDSSGADGAKEKRTPNANQCYGPSDFVTGKERMPPDGKKGSGSKRPLPPASGRDPKRAALEPASTGKLISGAMKRCGQILSKLMKHKHGWIFNVPVDVDGMGLHDYNQIIKHPMDLGTVKTKLGKNLYASPLDFASDVRLTFNNALVYNPKGHDVYNIAEQLLARFEEMFKPSYKKFENEQQRMIAVSTHAATTIAASAMEMRRNSWTRVPTPERSRKLEHAPVSTARQAPVSNPPPNPQAAQRPAQTPPSAAMKPLMAARSAMVKQPKPKAKDPNKREMSFEEKEKLGKNLESLPDEKMVQGDEIELDIEVLDTETLWELDRFVFNFKKVMSKIKRQSIATNPLSVAQDSQALVDEKTEAAAAAAAAPMSASAKKVKKGETVEEDVDIGEDIPTNNFPPVEIEKDAGCASRSSSSSSSSSDSSSSSGMKTITLSLHCLPVFWVSLGRAYFVVVADSDSGSSSGSDSDTDEAQSPFVESRVSPRTQGS
uniref:Bromo domain-containing protein n=1 Tax=Nelumbo nucifera TaxID=4432 RepID=A0A822XRB6_NELNU|nr:TPA_asm: hypothetical protein HUJ06_023666 [Nelumbo nucifera]